MSEITIVADEDFSKYEIIKPNGSILYMESMDTPTRRKKITQVANSPSGIYFVRIVSESTGTILITKFVKL